MLQRVAMSALAKVVVRRGAWNLVRAMASAAIGAIGWRLGLDAYEALKKRATPPPFDPELEPED